MRERRGEADSRREGDWEGRRREGGGGVLADRK